MERTEGLVIEINEQHMVVMCDDGMFRNLPLPEQLPRIGERVIVDLTARLAGQRRPSFISRTGQWTKMISAAAVLLLVLISALFWQTMGQNQAFGMANVDINPSVNLYFDEKGMIIKVETLNGDGEKVTESLDLLDKPIVQAIPLIWESALNQGYLHNNRENAMMVSVVPLNDEQERNKAVEAYVAQIKQELRTGWEQQGITGYIEVLAVELTVKEAAEKTKVSVNKYILQQEAIGMGMVIHDDELDSSIYEIVNKGNLRQFFEKINAEDKKDKPNHATQGKNSGVDRDSKNNNNNEGQKSEPAKHPKEQNANEKMNERTPDKKESGKPDEKDEKKENHSPKRNDKPDKPASESNPNKPQPKPEVESKVQGKGTPQPGVPAVDYKKGNVTPENESAKDDTDLEEDGPKSTEDNHDNSYMNNRDKNEKKGNKNTNKDPEKNDKK